jgi:hypothetical protein
MSDQHDTDPSITTQQQIEQGADEEVVAESRRAFLRRLVLGGSLALGAGGFAAYLANQDRTTVVILPNGDAVSVPASTDVSETFDLMAELASLRAALAESDEERRSLSSQLADAQAEINRLAGDREGLLSLVGLYEALEDIGLDNIVEAGFVALGVGMSGARALVALLEAGAQRGFDILQDLIEDFPSPQEGIVWLKGEVSALLVNLDNVADQIKEVIEPLEPFATLVVEFILDVLKKLPFGLGNPARGGLEAMQAVVTGLPVLADGIVADVLDPLETWFGQNQRTNLIGTLVGPIESDLINPANDTIEAVNALDTSYQNDLMSPAQTAIGERAAIRAQIDQQRAQLSDTALASLNRRKA